MKVCNDQTCSTPCTGRWCEYHAKARQSEARRRNGRNVYSSDWRRISVRVRRRHPVCQCIDVDCRCGGSCASPSAEVDHVVPLVCWASPKAANDISNLQALCKQCHSSKTRRKDGTRPMPATTRRETL